MTDWKTPSGHVVKESNLANYILRATGQGAIISSFESDFNEGMKPVDVLREYAGEDAYREEFAEWLDTQVFTDPEWFSEMTGLIPVGVSPNRRSTVRGGCKGCSSCSRCIKKKTTAASKPKSKMKTASSQRKPRSGGGRR